MKCTLVAGENWEQWLSYPTRAPVWFVKGGPGQGKSTIGQFFSQVHRAACILSDNENVAPLEVRKVADEIRISAQRLGVWPLIPRIPFSIELKRYAQWLAAIGDNPAGILSFVAHELHQATEEPVDVQGLREFIRHNRCMVVFDGLDEVPTEQKDQIADAINAFFRSERTQADVFGLCTSRPQGYSGQFDRIPRVSQIELSPLPDDTGLHCARKLLEAERHQGEAQQAFERLAQAFGASQAVRELMRTPLQVHIMCVIVRSGHRPPERRWSLFNTFFNIIRQREANRELPDRPVATVLQRETRLLKDVHARLGFVLHARAETAEGAESELNQSDFDALVHRAVSEVKDEEIDVLTKTVLRAARDRLVLINTPMSAGSYKFDVRQLQEFFAAEYVYFGIESEEFRTRVELIAGDQHWKEVVHFVLSALVENGRRTELTIARDVLARLDSGSEREEALSTKLARSATIVSQLAADGVLDEDRNIRQIFKDLLEPLFSEIAHEGLEILAEACRRRAWLHEYLVSKAEQLVEAKSWGIAALLWQTSDESFATHARVVKWLRTVSDELIARLAIVSLETYDSRVLLKAWQQDIVLARLTSDRPLTAGLQELSAHAFHLFRGGDAFDAGWGKIQEILGPTKHRIIAQVAGTAIVEISSPALSDAERALLSRVAASLPSSGVAGIWKLSFYCAINPSVDTYAALLRRFGETWEPALCIPWFLDRRIGLMADGPSPAQTADAIESTGDWRGCIHLHRIVRVRAPGSAFGKQVGQKLLDVLPSLFTMATREAIGVWRSTRCKGDAARDDVLQVDLMVAKQVALDPRLASEVPATLLPRLMKISPGLRSVLDTGTSRFNFDERDVAGFPDQFEPMSFPQDLFLLPRVAGEIVSWFWSQTRPKHLWADEAGAQRRSRGETIGQVVHLSELRKIADSVNQEVAIVASATLLLAIVEQSDWGEVSRNVKALVAYSVEEPCFGPAVAFAAELAGRVFDAPAREIVSAILAAQNSTEGNDRRWQTVLSRWRQRSHAPVSNRGRNLLDRCVERST